MKRCYIVAVGLAILYGRVCCAGTISLQSTNSWIDGTGKWETPGNWSAGAPIFTNAVNFITNAASKTVTIDALTPSGNWVVNILVVSGPAGTVNTLQLTNAPSVTLETFSSLIISNGGALIVTNSAVKVDGAGNGSNVINSSVTMLGGSQLLSPFTYIGSATGTSGTLTSKGGTVTVSGSLQIADASGATGTVWQTGGQLTVTNNTTNIGLLGVGQMTLSNTTWLASEVGVANLSGSQGTLTMVGTTNVLSLDLDVGTQVGATGAVWMTGGQLIITNSFTRVGDSGVGQMTISNGTWLANIVTVGYAPGSSGTLTLVGGTNQVTDFMTIAGQGSAPGQTGYVWVTGGQLITTNNGVNVGSTGIGQMTISNATWLTSTLEVGSFGNTPTSAEGTLTSVNSTITISNIFAVGAEDTTTTGAVWLTSGQLISTNALAYVGWYGIGQMALSNTAWRAGEIIVGYVPGSQGTLTLVGGTNVLSSYLDVGAQPGATGAVWMTGGELIATNAGILVTEDGVGQITISNGTCVVGGVTFGDNGRAQGTLTLAGGTITVLGGVDVGFGGTQTLWMTGGQLTITNGTTAIGSYDVGRVVVSNGIWRARNVTLGSTPGSQGSLTVAGGVSSVYSNVTVGTTNCSASGVILITGGELHVTNDAVTAVLEVRDGTMIQTGGILDVDRLVITNPCAHFIHMGGTLIYGLVTLDPDLDADGDGMANGFEQANGLDPFDPSDAAKDNDGDGQSNLAEFLAGTDPNDNGSVFRIIDISRLGNVITVTWTGGRGVTNVLEQTIGAPGGSYSTNGFGTVATIFTSGSGLITNTYSEAVEVQITPSLFYRVRAGP